MQSVSRGFTVELIFFLLHINDLTDQPADNVLRRCETDLSNIGIWIETEHTKFDDIHCWVLAQMLERSLNMHRYWDRCPGTPSSYLLNSSKEK